MDFHSQRPIPLTTAVIACVIGLLAMPAMAQTFSEVSASFNGIDVGYEAAPEIVDIDRDGLLDLIIGKDNGELLWYEQVAQNSTTFQAMVPARLFWARARAEPAFTDLDNDGLLDLLVGCSQGEVRHYEQDAADPTSFPLVNDVFIPDIGAFTAPAVADIDGDNLLDILVGYRDENDNNQKVARYEQESMNSTTVVLLSADFLDISYLMETAKPDVTDLDMDGRLDVILGKDGHLIHYEQTSVHSTSFNLMSSSLLGVAIGDVPSPVFADLDDDGKLDLLVGEYDGNINYWESDTVTHRFNLRSTGIVPSSMANLTVADVDGNGLLDVVYASGRGNPENIRHVEQDAVALPQFTGVNSTYLTMDYNPAPDLVDIDGDGLLDLLSGTFNGPIWRFEQDAVNSSTWIEVTQSFSGIDDPGSGRTRTRVTDFDNDGLLDLLFGTAYGPTLYHYEQDAPFSDSFSYVTDSLSGVSDIGNNPHPAIADIDADGRLDLLIGTAYGISGDGGHIIHYEQDAVGSTSFTLIADRFMGIDAGQYSRPFVTDLDDDGFLDLLIGRDYFNSGKSHPVVHYESNLKTVFGGSVTTTVAASVDSFSAELGGLISSDDGHLVTRRGVVYSTTNPVPDFGDNQATMGSGLGSYSAVIDLEPNQTYYHRAFRANALGTEFGQVESFVTPASLALLTTKAVTGVSNVSASSGGIVDHEGGVPVTERGLCWGQSLDPEYGIDSCSAGAAATDFDIVMGSLIADTTYFVRAYAINSVGISYGQNESFHTHDMASLVGSPVSSVDLDSAVSGGEVTDENGAAVTVRGVCWSTSPGPTLADTCTSNGVGMGAFVSSLTGLDQDTRYYVRAYATNAYGTRWGDEQQFATLKNIRSMLSFDGVDSRCDTPYTLPDVGTMELWFKTGITDHGILWHNADATNWQVYVQNADLLVLITGGTLRFENIETNRWYHVAVTWEKYNVLGTDYANASFYVNGNLIDQSLGGSWSDPFTTLRFGASLADHSYFDGSIDEVRVWSGVRSGAQIRADMHNQADQAEPNLLLYYDFDHATGATVSDRTSNGHDGVMAAFPEDPWLISTVPVGDVGASVRSIAPTSVGTPGLDATVTISGGGNNVDFLGAYVYGPGEGSVNGDVFPAGVSQRLDLVWGLFEVGTVTAGVVVDYSGVNGITDPSAVKLLSRSSAVEDWTDVVSGWVHDPVLRTFTGANVTDFTELALGDGGENQLNDIFADSFESGDTSAWSATVP